MEKEKQYEVTIRCTTYQHAAYILDALHGFVMQETSFPFLILIVDDASTDGTAQIIRDFIKEEFVVDNPSVSWNNQDEYSDNLYAQHKSNKNCFIISMNLKQNLYRDQAKKRSLFEKWVDCSKYIACCDGDDYWIDRYKLQKQVDFLNNNSDCQLVFHNAIMRSQDHLFRDHVMCSFETGYFNLKQVFEYWQLPYSSVVLRSSIVNHPIYLELIKQVIGGWCYFIAAAKIGKVYGMSDCMSIYRKTVGGASSGMSLDFIIDVNYKFAYAARSEDAVRAIDKKARRMLFDNYDAYLNGDAVVRKAMAVAKTHNRYMAILVFWDYFSRLPKVGLKKIKMLIKKLIKKCINVLDK